MSSVDVEHPATGAQAVIADATDPARRNDVLFRVRREPGHEMSSWWPVAAFFGVSISAIVLLTFIPGGL